ncbi:hypothetical protein Tco_0127093 [Tanacetum coccineum]
MGSGGGRGDHKKYERKALTSSTAFLTVLTNASNSTTDMTELTASLTNLTAGRTEVTVTTNAINNSTASNATVGTNLPNANMSGFIAGVSSTSLNTTGPSDVQTCIPTVKNMRSVSYVVPMQPTGLVLVSANDVTKGCVLTANTKGPLSFAKLGTGEPSRETVNFCTFIFSAGNRVNVAISLESVHAVSERFAKSVYGFFLGKRVAYPVFISKDEMDAMLENGWFIRSTSLILKKWTPNANLLTESSYARAMIELRSNVELTDSIMVVVPKLVDEGCKSSKQVYQSASKKNGSNISGKKKQAGLTRQELGEKGANFGVVYSTHGTSSEASGSPTTTPLAEWINNLEKQMLDGKLVLVDGDENPLKKVDYPVKSDSDSEVEECLMKLHVL